MNSGRRVVIPGQATEEAIAEVGSEAGKSLVRGFARLGNAYVGKWASTKEAQAEAARLAIETASKIETAVALTNARREQEIEELDHQAALQRRRLERMLLELRREQMNLETIQLRALTLVEHDSNKSKSREIDEDWLFRFADLAQKVSDKDVQDLWARALCSAAVEGAAKLSAPALQTLGLLDKNSAESLKKFAAVVLRIGFFPHGKEGEEEPQQIDIPALVDLGLVKEFVRKTAYHLDDFAFEVKETLLGPLNVHLSLTKRGTEIVNGVFRRIEELPLGKEAEQKYLQNVFQGVLEQEHFVTIVPKLEAEFAVAIRVGAKTAISESLQMGNWRSSSAADLLSPRLRELLVWAEKRHSIDMIPRGSEDS